MIRHMPHATNPDQWQDGPENDPFLIWIGIIVLVGIISILISK